MASTMTSAESAELFNGRLYESKRIVRNSITIRVKLKGRPGHCSGSLGCQVSSEGREPLNRLLYKTTRSQTGYEKPAGFRTGLWREFQTHPKWSWRLWFASHA